MKVSLVIFSLLLLILVGISVIHQHQHVNAASFEHDLSTKGLISMKNQNLPHIKMTFIGSMKPKLEPPIYPDTKICRLVIQDCVWQELFIEGNFSSGCQIIIENVVITAGGIQFSGNFEKNVTILLNNVIAENASMTFPFHFEPQKNKDDGSYSNYISNLTIVNSVFKRFSPPASENNYLSSGICGSFHSAILSAGCIVPPSCGSSNDDNSLQSGEEDSSSCVLPSGDDDEQNNNNNNNFNSYTHSSSSSYSKKFFLILIQNSSFTSYRHTKYDKVVFTSALIFSTRKDKFSAPCNCSLLAVIDNSLISEVSPVKSGEYTFSLVLRSSLFTHTFISKNLFSNIGRRSDPKVPSVTRYEVFAWNLALPDNSPAEISNNPTSVLSQSVYSQFTVVSENEFHCYSIYENEQETPYYITDMRCTTINIAESRVKNLEISSNFFNITSPFSSLQDFYYARDVLKDFSNYYFNEQNQKPIKALAKIAVAIQFNVDKIIIQPLRFSFSGNIFMLYCQTYSSIFEYVPFLPGMKMVEMRNNIVVHSPRESSHFLRIRSVMRDKSALAKEKFQLAKEIKANLDNSNFPSQEVQQNSYATRMLFDGNDLSFFFENNTLNYVLPVDVSSLSIILFQDNYMNNFLVENNSLTIHGEKVTWFRLCHLGKTVDDAKYPGTVIFSTFSLYNNKIFAAPPYSRWILDSEATSSQQPKSLLRHCFLIFVAQSISLGDFLVSHNKIIALVSNKKFYYAQHVCFFHLTGHPYGHINTTFGTIFNFINNVFNVSGYSQRIVFLDFENTMVNLVPKRTELLLSSVTSKIMTSVTFFNNTLLCYASNYQKIGFIGSRYPFYMKSLTFSQNSIFTFFVANQSRAVGLTQTVFLFSFEISATTLPHLGVKTFINVTKNKIHERRADHGVSLIFLSKFSARLYLVSENEIIVNEIVSSSKGVKDAASVFFYLEDAEPRSIPNSTFSPNDRITLSDQHQELPLSSLEKPNFQFVDIIIANNKFHFLSGEDPPSYGSPPKFSSQFFRVTNGADRYYGTYNTATARNLVVRNFIMENNSNYIYCGHGKITLYSVKQSKGEGLNLVFSDQQLTAEEEKIYYLSSGKFLIRNNSVARGKIYRSMTLNYYSLHLGDIFNSSNNVIFSISDNYFENVFFLKIGGFFGATLPSTTSSFSSSVQTIKIKNNIINHTSNFPRYLTTPICRFGALSLYSYSYSSSNIQQQQGFEVSDNLFVVSTPRSVGVLVFSTMGENIVVYNNVGSNNENSGKNQQQQLRIINNKVIILDTPTATFFDLGMKTGTYSSSSIIPTYIARVFSSSSQQNENNNNNNNEQQQFRIPTILVANNYFLCSSITQEAYLVSQYSSLAKTSYHVDPNTFISISGNIMRVVVNSSSPLKSPKYPSILVTLANVDKIETKPFFDEKQQQVPSTTITSSSMLQQQQLPPIIFSNNTLEITGDLFHSSSSNDEKRRRHKTYLVLFCGSCTGQLRRSYFCEHVTSSATKQEKQAICFFSFINNTISTVVEHSSVSLLGFDTLGVKNKNFSESNKIRSKVQLELNSNRLMKPSTSSSSSLFFEKQQLEIFGQDSVIVMNGSNSLVEKQLSPYPPLIDVEISFNFNNNLSFFSSCNEVKYQKLISTSSSSVPYSAQQQITAEEAKKMTFPFYSENKRLQDDEQQQQQQKTTFSILRKNLNKFLPVGSRIFQSKQFGCSSETISETATKQQTQSKETISISFPTGTLSPPSLSEETNTKTIFSLSKTKRTNSNSKPSESNSDGQQNSKSLFLDQTSSLSYSEKSNSLQKNSLSITETEATKTFTSPENQQISASLSKQTESFSLSETRTGTLTSTFSETEIILPTTFGLNANLMQALSISAGSMSIAVAIVDGLASPTLAMSTSKNLVVANFLLGCPEVKEEVQEEEEEELVEVSNNNNNNNTENMENKFVKKKKKVISRKRWSDVEISFPYTLIPSFSMGRSNRGKFYRGGFASFVFLLLLAILVGVGVATSKNRELQKSQKNPKNSFPIYGKIPQFVAMFFVPIIGYFVLDVGVTLFATDTETTKTETTSTSSSKSKLIVSDLLLCIIPLCFLLFIFITCYHKLVIGLTPKKNESTTTTTITTNDSSARSTGKTNNAKKSSLSSSSSSTTYSPSYFLVPSMIWTPTHKKVSKTKTSSNTNMNEFETSLLQHIHQEQQKKSQQKPSLTKIQRMVITFLKSWFGRSLIVGEYIWVRREDTEKETTTTITEKVEQQQQESSLLFSESKKNTSNKYSSNNNILETKQQQQQEQENELNLLEMFPRFFMALLGPTKEIDGITFGQNNDDNNNNNNNDNNKQKKLTSSSSAKRQKGNKNNSSSSEEQTTTFRKSYSPFFVFGNIVVTFIVCFLSGISIAKDNEKSFCQAVIVISTILNFVSVIFVVILRPFLVAARNVVSIIVECCSFAAMIFALVLTFDDNNNTTSNADQQQQQQKNNNNSSMIQTFTVIAQLLFTVAPLVASFFGLIIRISKPILLKLSGSRIVSAPEYWKLFDEEKREKEVDEEGGNEMMMMMTENNNNNNNNNSFEQQEEESKLLSQELLLSPKIVTIRKKRTSSIVITRTKTRARNRNLLIQGEKKEEEKDEEEVVGNNNNNNTNNYSQIKEMNI